MNGILESNVQLGKKRRILAFAANQETLELSFSANRSAILMLDFGSSKHRVCVSSLFCFLSRSFFRRPVHNRPAAVKTALWLQFDSPSELQADNGEYVHCGSPSGVELVVASPFAGKQQQQQRR